MTEITVACLLLSDKRIVLQRRTNDAPTSPGKLGFFGGHIESGEKPDECIRRELKEETSLDPDKLDIQFVQDFIIEKDKDYPEDRHTYLYKANIPDANFEVYEGSQAEAYTLKEALQRDDLTVGVRHILSQMSEEKLWR